MRREASVRSALVTGAGSGIGRAVACGLVKEGYAIFCPDEEYDQDLQCIEGCMSLSVK